MEHEEILCLKNSSQEKLNCEINTVDHQEVKADQLVNYDDFNFEDFQFKSKRKTHPQATNDVEPVPPIAILECPLCGCKSKTDTAKSRHLKECAKKRGISFHKMLKAVELQKKQAEERRLAGLPVVPSKSAREPRRNTAVKRKLEPQTKLQADLQMALAMSLSLQQKQDKEENQERFFLEALTGESENEDTKLVTALRIGSTVDGKLQAVPGRKAKRKQHVITPFWLIRSKEETKAIRAERVVKILSEQSTDSDEENCPFIPNWKNIRQLCRVPWPSAGYCRLWETSTLSEAIRCDLNKFYVKTLEQWFPPKDVFNSEVKKNHPPNTQKRRRTEETECLPSTLAALNALHGNASPFQKDVTMETGLDGFLLDNTYGDGFFTQIPEIKHLDFSAQVVKGLLSMVNNNALSDAKIIIRNEEVLHCHQFILYTNCPAAYQELRNSIDQKLLWPDISRETAIHFLQFMYAGIFTGTDNEEMLQLAKRYKMQELLKLLNGYNDFHDKSDEFLPLTLKSGSTSSSQMSSYSNNPSPVLTSNLPTGCSISPVLTSKNRSFQSASQESKEYDDKKILSEHLPCEDLINIEMAKHSGYFEPSFEKSRRSHRKLSYTDSSVMSPELFSSGRDDVELESKLEKIESLLEKYKLEFDDSMKTSNKNEIEVQERIVKSPSPDPCLELSSASGTKSIDNCHGQNGTWNNFLEGYYSADNLQLMDGSLAVEKDEQDAASDSRRRSLPISPVLSAVVTSCIHPSISMAHSTSHVKPVNIYDKCHEFLDNVPSFGSLDTVWHDDSNDPHNNKAVSQCENDLPDIDPCPIACESVHQEEGCIGDYASLSGSLSSTPLQEMPPKKKKKLNKKLPKATCVTPMPHYSIMETPVIKKELQKIGVRPLPKKKGVTLLKHVYSETHPESTSHVREENGFKGDLASSKSNSEKGLDDSYNSISQDKGGVKKSKLSTKSKKKDGKPIDTFETQQCRSQTRATRTSPLKKTPEKGGNKRALPESQNEEMKAFIFVNTELRTRILDYQPIDFKSLHSDMKASGLKPSVQELQDFLDDQCITYTSLEESSPQKTKKRTCRRGKTRR